jgi:hypothetical protein
VGSNQKPAIATDSEAVKPLQQRATAVRQCKGSAGARLCNFGTEEVISDEGK